MIYIKKILYKDNLNNYKDMFSIEIIKDDIEDGYSPCYNVNLMYKKDGIEFSITPESVGYIDSIDECDEKGCFDTNPSNGCFMFRWDKNLLTFNVGKSGDGCGGYIYMTIENTEQIMESLKECLSEWKEVNRGYSK